MGQTLFKKPIIGPSQNKSSPSLTRLYFFWAHLKKLGLGLDSDPSLLAPGLIPITRYISMYIEKDGGLFFNVAFSSNTFNY